MLDLGDNLFGPVEDRQPVSHTAHRSFNSAGKL